MAQAKSEMVSILAPTTSSRAIIEFREKIPALWSLTSLNFSDRGFGTAWTGVLYIPGKSSFPKLSKYLLAPISESLCSLRKSA